MSILDKMKSLVMEEVEEPETKTVSTTITPTLPFPSPPIINSSSSIPPEKIATLDKSANDKLNSAIIDASPQFYVKLNDLLTTLAESIPTEASQYKTALKLLAKEGATPLSLISDLDKCIGAIEKKNREFSDFTTKKVDEQIGGRKNKISSIEQSIADKTQQIVLLQADIANLTQQKQEENNLIASESQKITQAQERFVIVYNAMHQQLDLQKQKINEYSK